MCCKVHPTLECRNTFEWSFKPAVLWFKWSSGFNLIPSPSCGWNLLFGIVALLANLVINASALYAAVNALNFTDALSTVDIFSVGLERVNFACYTLGIHLIFFVVSSSAKWKDLWANLIDIQKHNKLNGHFYRRVRKVVLIGSAFFMMHVALSIYLSVSLFCPWPPEGGFFRPIVVTMANILENITVGVLVLFCLLVWTAIALQEALGQQLITNPTIVGDEVRLEEWRQAYGLAGGQLTSRINNSFGLVLLVAISSIFVNFITVTFALTSGFRPNGNDSLQIQFSLILLKNFALLWVITFGPYLLRSKAADVVETLRQSGLSSLPNLANKFRFNALMMEVGQHVPRITAMEFFDVDMQLFPALVGTTLTYLVILYQSDQ